MYNHLYHRVEYPRERGYRMEAYQVPNWLSLEITEDKENDSKQLIVHSKIHVNKRVELNPTYSCKFSDDEILKDMSHKVWDMFIR